MSYTERFSRLKLPTLNYRRLRGDMIEVFKITHSLYDPDVSLNLAYQGCKRDLSLRDRDETETFGFWSETRPRPRPSCNSTRPRRLIFATRRDRDRDLARPRPRRFSRPSTCSIVPKQWMANLPLLMSQTAQSLQLQLQCSLSWNLFTT